MDAKDVLSFLFQRADAMQTFWNIFLTVVTAILGLAAAAKKEWLNKLSCAVITIGFAIFAYSNFEALKDLRVMFPKVPSKSPEGARNENSTYLHLLVVYLEYRALRELFGELKGKQVMEFWAEDHYTWIYKTVIERPRDIGNLMFKHKLVPPGQ